MQTLLQLHLTLLNVLKMASIEFYVGTLHQRNMENNHRSLKMS